MDDIDTQERKETVNATAANASATNYTANNTPSANSPAMEPTVTTGDWFLTLFITAIPLIGLIMLFVWAFGGGANENKSNWAKAMLLWILIGIVLSAVVVGVFFAKYYRRFAAGF